MAVLSDLPSKTARISVLLLITALWFLSTPYEGIWNDANLYALQALHRVHPQNYAKEFFFSFGSQDDFTIFSTPYGFLIEKLGLSTAALLMFYSCQLFWLSGALRLFRQLLPEQISYLCLALMLLTRHHYGGNLLFAYAEGFVTARLPAEAASLWALSFCMQNRFLLAWALSVLAVLIHPLIGVWALALCVLRRMSWRWALCAILAVSVLALLPILGSIGPSRLTARFDPAWFHLLHNGQVPNVFLDTWTGQDLLQVLVTVFAISCGALFASEKTKNFWRILLALMLATFALTYIATVPVHHVLLTQLQPWRILWIAQCLQWAVIASCVSNRSAYLPIVLLVFALLIAFTATDLQGQYWRSYPFVLAILILPAWIHRAGLHHDPLTKTSSKTLDYAATAVLMGLMSWSWIQHLGIYTLDQSLIKGYVYFNILPAALVCVIFGTLLYVPLKYLTPLATTVTLILFALGALLADARRPLEIKEMQCTGKRLCINEAHRLIKPGSLVYWEDRDGYSGSQSTWFYAEAANYISAYQSSSRPFSRDLSLTDERRRRLLNGFPPRENAILIPDSTWKMDAEFTKADYYDIRPRLNAEGIARLCSDLELDYIVTELLHSDFEPMLLQSKAPQRVYDCKRVRQKT